MIITEIYNGQGLGNQLWCYATTRVIARDRGFNFGIMHPEKFKCLDFMDLDFGKPIEGGEGPEGGPPTKLPKGIAYYYPERRISHPDNGVDVRTFDPHLIDILDNTKIDGVMQDERYIIHRKEEIRQWLKVKKEFECFDYAADDICVINFRGNEYVKNTRIFLPQSYWDNAISNIRKINKHMRFVVITDDVKTAKTFFPAFEVHHFSIAKDYVILKNAHYLILSNSSFACFPVWLNEKVKLCIAPKYWSQYNFSDGYWGCSYNIYSGWMYQNRDGVLEDATTCRKELQNYMDQHPEIFAPKRITKNFLVISNFKNDTRWIPDFSDNYLIYDQSDKSEYPAHIDRSKIIKSKHTGHNLSDYCTFIIDHYDNLPEITILGKGNMFPRHVRRQYFEHVMNNEYFTPIEDPRMHNPVWPKGFFSSDGGFNEINNSLYLKAPGHPLKYFDNYNKFLKFIFKNPIISKYVRFPPGAMFVLPRAHILKYPKVFYENLRTIVSYDFFPGEAYILERASYTIWAGSFELNKAMLSPLDPSFTTIMPPSWLDLYKEKLPLSVRKRIPTPLKKIAVRYYPLAKKIRYTIKKYL